MYPFAFAGRETKQVGQQTSCIMQCMVSWAPGHFAAARRQSQRCSLRPQQANMFTSTLQVLQLVVLQRRGSRRRCAEARTCTATREDLGDSAAIRRRSTCLPAAEHCQRARNSCKSNVSVCIPRVRAQARPFKAVLRLRAVPLATRRLDCPAQGHQRTTIARQARMAMTGAYQLLNTERCTAVALNARAIAGERC